MASETTPLDAEIRRIIGIAGPMPVAEYMAICLSHPQHGFYISHDPLGQGGDFTTSPEISQMFGELVGLWAAAVWRMLGAPPSINLVELGPGRGTLMVDALRAAKVLPSFDKAISVHLVETSPLLQQSQQRKLAGSDKAIAWHRALADVPGGPAVILANEFFDALPINQAVKHEDGWHTRTVDIGADGKLVFAVAPMPLQLFDKTLPAAVREAAPGSIFEWRTQQSAMELGRRVRDGGTALVIDYGHRETAIGDSFQAVRGHRYDDPLNAPGFADLTAHVDFQALGAAAATMGARVHGPADQAVFLRALGIEKRAEALKFQAPEEKHTIIDAAVARLTATEGTGMGRLFKVLGLSPTKLYALPGLDGRLPWMRKT